MGRFGSQSRRPIQQQVKRKPRQHDEIPVKRVVGDVAETARGGMSREHQRRKDQGVHEVGNQMGGVQAKHDPDSRTIRVQIPPRVQVGELEASDDQQSNSDDRHHDQPYPDAGKVQAMCNSVGDFVGNDACEEYSGRKCSRPQIWWSGVDRPFLIGRLQVQIRANRYRKSHSLEGDESHRAPPGNARRTEFISRQLGDVAHDLLFHSSSSLSPLGQNQPINATATGGVPQTTAHGVKIDPIKKMHTVTAVISGQILGSGEELRVCGSASATVPSSTSRFSTLKPATTASWSGSAHSGSRWLTTGMREKL